MLLSAAFNHPPPEKVDKQLNVLSEDISPCSITAVNKNLSLKWCVKSKRTLRPRSFMILSDDNALSQLQSLSAISQIAIFYPAIWYSIVLLLLENLHQA